MRSFPRAPLRRRVLLLALVAAVVSVLVSALAVPLAEAKDKKHDLQQKQQRVHKQQQRAQGDLDESSASLRRATRSLTAAQDRLRTARSRLHTVNGRLTSARTAHARIQTELEQMKDELSQARADLAAGQQDVTEQRAAVRDGILAGFEGGTPEMKQLATLMGTGTSEQLTRQEAYGDAVSSSQDATLQRLEASKTLLTVHEKDVKDATAKVATKEHEAAQKVAEIRTLRGQAVTARNQVLDLVQKRATAKKRAARIKAHDQRELSKLKKQEERIRKQILALSRKGGNRRVGRTTGMFAPPVRNSYITSPYGWRRHPIYHYWGLHDGDDLHAPCGTPERAIDTGRVISTYYSSVWGNRLYLYLGRINGHSYTAIYNHISRYKAHVGQVVGRGDTLAYAGTTGWSTACHLHFTIMRDGKAVNPSPLLGY